MREPISDEPSDTFGKSDRGGGKIWQWCEEKTNRLCEEFRNMVFFLLSFFFAQHPHSDLAAPVDAPSSTPGPAPDRAMLFLAAPPSGNT